MALLLPSRTPTEETSEKVSDIKQETIGFITGLTKVLTNPALVLVFITKLFSSSLNSMYESSQPAILKDSFKLKEAEMGYVMSATMLCNALASAVLVGPLSRRLTAHQL